jgi:hypothetical protein
MLGWIRNKMITIVAITFPLTSGLDFLHERTAYQKPRLAAVQMKGRRLMIINLKKNTLNPRPPDDSSLEGASFVSAVSPTSAMLTKQSKDRIWDEILATGAVELKN